MEQQVRIKRGAQQIYKEVVFTEAIYDGMKRGRLLRNHTAKNRTEECYFEATPIFLDQEAKEYRNRNCFVSPFQFSQRW